MVDVRTFKMMLDTRHDLYYDLKGMFLYHTNKMEGSTFTQLELTTLINENIVTGRHQFDDVIETRNSIELFDYIINGLNEQPLNKFVLREMHSILKKGTSDEKQRFVGRFKPIPNAIRGSNVKLSEPFNVESDLDNLLAVPIEGLSDIVKFHAQFEQIHPFTDGNGRIGRMLITKQCIECDIAPIIITDENARRYKESLSVAQLTGDYNDLNSIFIEGQKEFINSDVFTKLIEVDKYYVSFLNEQDGRK